MTSPYEIAKGGGKHKGLLVQLENFGSVQLERAIRSHRKTAEDHLRKIGNPSSVIDDWENRTELYRQGVIRKWQAEVDNSLEQVSIIEAYRNEKQT